MNLNVIRTALTSISAILVAIMGFAPQILGCSYVEATGGFSCVNSWLPPAYVGIAATVLLVLNIALKAIAGGTVNFGALVKPSAVVSDSGNPGTVAPHNVVPK